MYYSEDKIFNIPARIKIIIAIMKICLVIALIVTSQFATKIQNEIKIKREMTIKEK